MPNKPRLGKVHAEMDQHGRWSIDVWCGDSWAPLRPAIDASAARLFRGRLQRAIDSIIREAREKNDE